MSEAERSSLIKDIDQVLNEVRPHLKVDGGDIEVITVTDDMTVKVRWIGNCINCSMSAMTMKAGIEQTIKSKYPEIQNVVAVNGVAI